MINLAHEVQGLQDVVTTQTLEAFFALLYIYIYTLNIYWALDTFQHLSFSILFAPLLSACHEKEGCALSNHL